MGVDALEFSGGSEELNLNLDGWEGPLDLLLNLARAQKVDLAQISILQLVDRPGHGPDPPDRIGPRRARAPRPPPGEGQVGPRPAGEAVIRAPYSTR